MVEVKFCGMTRPEDAAHAAAIGASYVGIIFAESPRRLDAERARDVFAAAKGVRRAGVFGAGATTREIVTLAHQVALDVIQLHGDPSASSVSDLRSHWSGAIWAVQRIGADGVPSAAAELFDVADGVVLDAKVDGKLGGTGVALPWAALRASLMALRGRRARLIVAGGLRAENVGTAVAELDPDVVDVSSGVESSVGVKDLDAMSVFRAAALAPIAR